MEMSSKSDSQVNLAATSSPSSGMVFKLLVVVTIVCAAIAVVAVILGAVAMNKSTPEPTAENSAAPQTSDGSATDGNTMTDLDSGSDAPKERTWLIAHGPDWASYEYIDDAGFMVGFSHEIIEKVCRAAGMKCRTVWDPYTNCWNSLAGEHPRSGQGLAGDWYDACTMWVPTVERIHVMRFTKEMLRLPPTNFMVKYGDTTFNAANITGKKIGFVDGWFHNEQCLARSSIAGSYLTVSQILHVPNPAQLRDAILDGTVDAGFAEGDLFANEIQARTLKPLTVPLDCGLSGNGMMSKKGNPFTDEFNRGIDKIMSNGEYRDLCAKSTKHERGQVYCLNV